MENIKIGQKYNCKPVGLENNVIGVVESLYTNTVLISVNHHEIEDKDFVSECKYRMIVKYKDLVKEMIQENQGICTNDKTHLIAR